MGQTLIAFSLRWVSLWLSTLGVGVLVLTWFRVWFWIWNQNHLEWLPLNLWPKALLKALQGDLAGLGYIWGPSYLALFAGTWFRRPSVRAAIWWVTLGLGTTLIFFLCSLDVVFFAHLGQRLTVGHFYIFREVNSRDWAVLRLFGPYIMTQVVAWGVTLWALWRLNKTWLHWPKPKTEREIAGLFLVFGLGLMGLVVMVRGGLQPIPLKIDAFFSSDWSLKQAQGLMNTPLVLAHSFQDALSESWEPTLSAEEVVRFFNQPQWQRQYPHLRDFSGKNVILVIVEGLSGVYLTPKPIPHISPIPILPQLWSIGQEPQGKILNPTYALGRRTVEGLLAIWLSLPSWQQPPLLFQTSWFMSRWESLPWLFQKKGYTTLFFHGSLDGSLNIHSAARALGFQKVYSLENYPNPRDSDGVWGIPDHLYLPWVVDELNQTPQPFMASILTLSSHYPYWIPKDMPSFKAPIHDPFVKSLHFADESLGLFWRKVQQQTWSRNTLFIFVADHVGEMQHRDPSSIRDYEIPMIFYLPEKGTTLPNSFRGPVAQWDIKPTLVDWFQLTPSEVQPFGYPLDQAQAPRYVIYRHNNCFWVLNESGIWDPCSQPNSTNLAKSTNLVKQWQDLINNAWNYYAYALKWKDFTWPKKLDAKPQSTP